MTTSCNIDEEQVSKFKQEVFARLAFLGMKHDDAAALRHLWKFVNLSAKLVTDEGDQSAKSEKLVRALSRELGASRAQLFVRWFADTIKLHFAKELAMPVPQVKAPASLTEPASLVVADAKVTEVKAETNVQIALKPSCGTASAIDAGVPLCSTASVVTATDKDAVHAHPEVKETSTVELGDEAWVEVKAHEGKTYYWDRCSNKCAWALPAGIKPMWSSHKSPDGRTYYSDRNSKSFWVMPPLVKPAANSNTCTLPEPSKVTVATQGLPESTQPTAAADLGPPVEVLPPQAPNDSQAAPSSTSICDSSSDVSSLRQELAELKKQLASLTENRSPSSANSLKSIV